MSLHDEHLADLLALPPNELILQGLDRFDLLHTTSNKPPTITCYTNDSIYFSPGLACEGHTHAVCVR